MAYVPPVDGKKQTQPWINRRLLLNQSEHNSKGRGPRITASLASKFRK